MSHPKYQPIWAPPQNATDCSQGYCSIYCPQWCYVIFPPPPPLGLGGRDSGTAFSPLVIAIIGILASAFLLVSYYTVVAKYCGNWDSFTRRLQGNPNENFDENHHTFLNEPWHAPSSGLDESVIRSITVCKYKRADGLIEGTDCSVCLSEFQEDENLRLLPKCSHAFHISCIDRWLQAHSNCPLCRASVVYSSLRTPPRLPPTEITIVVAQESVPEPTNSPENETCTYTPAAEDAGCSTVGAEDSAVMGRTDQDGERLMSNVSQIPSRTQSDLGRKEDAIIEISREEMQALRRSV